MDEDIVVADTNNHRIQIFEKTGDFKYQFGQPGIHISLAFVIYHFVSTFPIRHLEQNIATCYAHTHTLDNI